MEQMHHQVGLEYQQRRAYELVTMIESLNTTLARFKDQKSVLEDELLSLLQHTHEGQKTYMVADKAVSCKTVKYYRVNKALYLADKSGLPDDYNPIVTKIDYEVDKHKYKRMLESAPADVVDVLRLMVVETEGKAAITIQSRNI